MMNRTSGMRRRVAAISSAYCAGVALRVSEASWRMYSAPISSGTRSRRPLCHTSPIQRENSLGIASAPVAAGQDALSVVTCPSALPRRIVRETNTMATATERIGYEWEKGAALAVTLQSKDDLLRTQKAT